MTKRRGLSKRIRFEVFKRDSFRCQYCGRAAPDVILEVDHIIPVSSGGGDDVLNLVTACRDCNRGKTNKQLSDTSVIDRQRKQLDDLNAMREQTEMLIQWKSELLSLSESQIDSIDNLFSTMHGCSFTKIGRSKIRTYINRFGFTEVYAAAEIAFSRYNGHSDAIDKIGGICYNREKQRAGEGDAE